MSTNRNVPEESPEATVQDASTPFDHADADIILRSCDNVDFHVFKVILSLASPFFKDMFSLPQASATEDGDKTRGGLVVIQVTETSSTLENLLLMCYPMAAVEAPELDDLELVFALLEAAIKYNVERVQRRVIEWLMAPRFLDVDAVRVYAVACRCRLLDEATAAAKASLRQPHKFRRPYGTELQSIMADQLYQLLQYHDRCEQAAEEVLNELSWIEHTDFPWLDCGSCYDRIDIPRRQFGTAGVFWCPEWWTTYMEAVVDSFLGIKGKKIESLTETAITQASQCSYCGSSSSRRMSEFKDMLIARLHSVVDEVPVDLQI